LERLNRAAPVAEERAATADKELNEWRSKWAEAMAWLRQDLAASPQAANAVVEGLGKLFLTIEKADGYRERIQGIERDAQTFAATTDFPEPGGPSIRMTVFFGRLVITAFATLSITTEKAFR
jgi:hypothetical protein